MKRLHGLSLENRMQRTYFVLGLPSLIIYAFGVLIPIIIGFYFSLTDWNGLSPVMNFIGFKNYLHIFTEPRFYSAFGFTLAFVVFNTVIQNALALLFAIALDTGIKAKNFYKTIIYIPCLLSPILIGFLWSRLFGTIYPGLFEGFPFANQLKLLTNPDTVLGGLLVINNWQWVGYWMLIYLAALQSVPREMYEASSIEGASAVRKFISITVPMIMPAITICVVSITLGGFQVYDLIVTATNGGPGHASESFIMYIYNQAFSAERAAFASANSMVYVCILLVVALIQIFTLRKREVQL